MDNARLKLILLGGAALALVGALAVVFWPSAEPDAGRSSADVVPSPELSQPPPAPDLTKEPSPPATAKRDLLPPLNESDAFVRAQARSLNLPPTWIFSDELVRRLAVLIENASRGEIPSKRPSLFFPKAQFPVRQHGDRLFMDPAGYARYDPYLNQLERIDPTTLATFFNLLKPLLNEALLELGQRGYADVSDAAKTAIDQVLATPVLEGDIELVQPKAMLQYATPSLESLGALRKQVLRMGPNNVQRLHAYLSRLRPLL